MWSAVLETLLLETVATNITIQWRNEAKQQDLKTKYGIHIWKDPHAQIVVLGIKPQQLDDIDFTQYPSDAVLFSMLVGVSLETLRLKTRFEKIIRCMPNLCLFAKKWLVPYVHEGNINKTILDFLKTAFARAGSFFEIQNEKMLDKITSISGSWPAYFFYFTELLKQKTMELGFDEATATFLAEQTFIGAAQTLEQSDLDAKALKESVASKWGSTQQALDSFESVGLGKIISDAVDAAYERVKELG